MSNTGVPHRHWHDLIAIHRGGGLALTLLAGMLVAHGAWADSLRCGNRLITAGDTIEQVRQQCGEPTETKRTWITRQPRFEYGGQEIPFEGQEDVGQGSPRCARQSETLGGNRWTPIAPLLVLQFLAGPAAAVA